MQVTARMTINNDTPRWKWTAWLWVIICVASIFSTIPFVRSAQKFVYAIAEKETITYAVIISVCFLLGALFYALFFKFRVKKASQYVWLALCAGLYIYFTIKLRKYPEEAVHLLVYGLLSYFVFNALSYKIRDWTVYPSTVLIVIFFGIADELIQWMIPGRYWGLHDVWINLLASVFFVLAVWKGIVPQRITGKIRKDSVRILTGILIINLIFIGLCLSNTPDTVLRYTEAFDALSWLRNEEPMTEYGYKHKDPEIGTFYSRLTVEEINETDFNYGESYGRAILNEDVIDMSAPYADIFIYEFHIHASRRNVEFKEFRRAGSRDSRVTALKENQILEKYFGKILKHSDQSWPSHYIDELGNSDSIRSEAYSSETGRLIATFSLMEVRALIFITLVAVIVAAHIWKKRLT